MSDDTPPEETGTDEVGNDAAVPPKKHVLSRDLRAVKQKMGKGPGYPPKGRKFGEDNKAALGRTRKEPEDIIHLMTNKILDGVRRVSQREYFTITVVTKNDDGSVVEIEQRKLKKLSAADLNAMCNAASALTALRDQHAAGEEVRAIRQQLNEAMETIAQLMQGRTG